MADRLSPEEIEHVRELQIGLRAQKACLECGETKPVEQFPGFGRSFCRSCVGAIAA